MTNSTKHSFLLLAAATALVVRPGGLRAQAECQSDVPMETHPYAYHFRGDRCEGRCGRLVSNTTALRVVGFRRGAALPISGHPPMFAVRWAPPGNDVATLRVSAVAGALCYQMDATQPPAATRFTWSSRLAAAIGIRPTDLVAVVWTSYTEQGFRQPLAVPVEPDAGRALEEGFVVEIMPAREFSEVSFTLTVAADGRRIVSGQSLGEAFYPEDRLLSLKLPPNLPERVPLRLLITGRYQRGSSSTEVLLWIPR